MKKSIIALLLLFIMSAAPALAQTTPTYSPKLVQRAESGDAKSQYNLGQCFYSGRGVPVDYKQAASWYRKAAAQGYTDAEYNLGTCYYLGNGITKDFAQAVTWFRKAADKGHAEAQYNLGLCYERGEGVEQSEAEAIVWYKKSAANGFPLASMILEQLGVK